MPNKISARRVAHGRGCRHSLVVVVGQLEIAGLFHNEPDVPVLKLRFWGFQPQRGGAMSAQGNALGWRFTVNFKP